MKITVKQLRKLISETVEELEIEEQDEELETSLHEDEAVAEDEEGWLVPEGRARLTDKERVARTGKRKAERKSSAQKTK